MAEEMFPVKIKKKNGFMLSVGILEIVCGLIWSLQGGLKSLPMWLFVVVGVITILSVLVEYSRDIYLKENAIEFYVNKDLAQKIKYSEIAIIDIKNGEKPADKKKQFLHITFDEVRKKKTAKRNHYSFCISNYDIKDIEKIRDVIASRNQAVRITDIVKELGKEKANK